MAFSSLKFTFVVNLIIPSISFDKYLFGYLVDFLSPKKLNKFGWFQIWELTSLVLVFLFGALFLVWGFKRCVGYVRIEVFGVLIIERKSFEIWCRARLKWFVVLHYMVAWESAVAMTIHISQQFWSRWLWTFLFLFSFFFTIIN